MRKALLAAAMMVAAQVTSHSAHAQWAVFDSSNYANTLQTMQTTANQLTVLNNQLNQLRQTTEQISAMQMMFTNPSNILGMLPQLNLPSLQNSMPTASGIPGQILGEVRQLTALGQQFYTANHVFTATGEDPQALLLNRAGFASANIQGMAAANLAAIEQRQQNLNVMQMELQGATDIKQVAAINGRIAIEANAIQGQQAQAQNLLTLATTQAQADQQAALQSIRQGHEETAAQFTGVLN